MSAAIMATTAASERRMVGEKAGLAAGTVGFAVVSIGLTSGPGLVDTSIAPLHKSPMQ